MEGKSHVDPDLTDAADAARSKASHMGSPHPGTTPPTCTQRHLGGGCVTEQQDEKGEAVAERCVRAGLS